MRRPFRLLIALLLFAGCETTELADRALVPDDDVCWQAATPWDLEWATFREDGTMSTSFLWFPLTAGEDAACSAATLPYSLEGDTLRVYDELEEPAVFLVDRVGETLTLTRLLEGRTRVFGFQQRGPATCEEAMDQVGETGFFAAEAELSLGGAEPLEATEAEVWAGHGAWVLRAVLPGWALEMGAGEAAGHGSYRLLANSGELNHADPAVEYNLVAGALEIGSWSVDGISGHYSALFAAEDPAATGDLPTTLAVSGAFDTTEPIVTALSDVSGHGMSSTWRRRVSLLRD